MMHSYVFKLLQLLIIINQGLFIVGRTKVHKSKSKIFSSNELKKNISSSEKNSDNSEPPEWFAGKNESGYVNPELGKAFEGDILVFRRTSTRLRRALWPNAVVHYYLDYSITRTPWKIRRIHSGMRSIEANTCVRFQRVWPNPWGRFPVRFWVHMRGDLSGCFSEIGHSFVGPSSLNLGERCFEQEGHVIHEIMHTLGIHHEHMRPDRDRHVRIFWNNIQRGEEHNFVLMSDNAVTYYGLPYDYHSIMHYEPYSFSRDHRYPTILPYNNRIRIGQRNRLSRSDIEKLRITYNCPGRRTKVNFTNTEHHIFSHNANTMDKGMSTQKSPSMKGLNSLPTNLDESLEQPYVMGMNTSKSVFTEEKQYVVKWLNLTHPRSNNDFQPSNEKFENKISRLPGKEWSNGDPTI